MVFPALITHDPEARRGEVAGADQAIVTAAGDHDIVGVMRHSCSIRFPRATADG